MKKKVFGIILVLITILSIFPVTAMAAQFERCPLCGTENSFVYYNKDYGYCYKCHRTNDTVCLNINVKSDALSYDEVEVIVYNNGKVERMAVVPSGDQTIMLSGLQRGWYTVCINMNGCMPITQTIYLYNKDNNLSYTMRLRGDVNGDGVVSEIDYNMVKSYLNHRGWLYGYQYQCADVNGDWRVDNKDLEILNLSVFD